MPPCACGTAPHDDGVSCEYAARASLAEGLLRQSKNAPKDRSPSSATTRQQTRTAARGFVRKRRHAAAATAAAERGIAILRTRVDPPAAKWATGGMNGTTKPIAPRPAAVTQARLHADRCAAPRLWRRCATP